MWRNLAKGSNGLVSHLKKSYSLNDLSEEQNTRTKEPADATDNPYYEDPRLIRRNTVQNPRQIIPPPGLYFSEFDVNLRPGAEYLCGQVPSSEKISLGYSSGDSLSYGMPESKGGHLVRTASLGPSCRVRTRAATKHDLIKRSSLSEGGSTWSAMESHESQKETDNMLNLPFPHSASFPFSLSPLQPFSPEYQRMFTNFGNLTQNQMFTFINHSQYPTTFFNQNVESENNCGGVLESGNESSNNFSIAVSGDGSVKPEDQTEVPVISKKLKNEEEKKEVLMEKIDKSTEKSETVEKKSREGGIEKNENPEKVAQLSESIEIKERSGKYNKKPAPIPPIEEFKITNTNLEVEEEEADFHTPSASPKFERKHNSNTNLSASQENNGKPHDSNFLEVPVKSKSKSKKKDFKLHMPKMSFSFWHQKNGKHSSNSETSSVASVEIATTQSENKDKLEYFISLKDDDDNKSKETGFRICNSAQSQEKRKEESKLDV